MTTTPPEAADEHALVEALKPFADLADYIAEEKPAYDTDHHEVQIENWPYTLSVGWLRAARAALAAARPDDEREAVVRWLRSLPPKVLNLNGARLADAIEQGQHREQSRG